MTNHLVIKESENGAFNRQFPIGSVINIFERDGLLWVKDIDPSKRNWEISNYKEGNFKCLDT